jgi:hypothetical protein
VVCVIRAIPTQHSLPLTRISAKWISRFDRMIILRRSGAHK